MRIVNPPMWEELRSRILKAIEEEKRAGSQVYIPRASVGTYPPVAKHGEKYYGSTANEDSHVFFEDMPSAV